MIINAFYSDPHFFHTNIIKYCNRPFNNINEMNSCLITNYNNIIGINDTVLWLGDCFFKSDTNARETIIRNLNGNKILIMGNHDYDVNELTSIGFDLVLLEAVICINNNVCRISHFPYDPNQFKKPDKFAKSRPKRNNGEFLLHGHDHNKSKITGINSINVGVDAWDYKPVLIKDIENLIQEMKK